MAIGKFSDRIMDRLVALNSVSETVGPGRMAKCEAVSVQVGFGAGATTGTAEIQWSHHQSFPGTPVTVASVAWSAPESGDVVNIDPKYFNGFIRVRLTTASDGQGVSAWASGR